MADQQVNRKNKIQSKSVRKFINIIDLIIGNVVASRLSENKQFNVLLLEAGGDDSAITNVPFAYTYIFDDDNYFWRYQIEPAPNTFEAFDKKKLKTFGGKVLGGGSGVNAMIYNRGNKNDFNKWRDMGCDGWGYDDVLEYFKKSEDIQIKDLENSTYHAQNGHLTVSHLKYITPIAQVILDAGAELGYATHDVNGENQTGFMLTQTTTRNGKRCS